MLRLAVLGVCLATSACGFGGDPHERDAYGCDRGFRKADWREERLKTAQSIAKCNWLKGWSERRVRSALGPPDGGDGAILLMWGAGNSSAGIGPMGWSLYVRFNGDRHGPRVVRARTELHNV